MAVRRGGRTCLQVALERSHLRAPRVPWAPAGQRIKKLVTREDPVHLHKTLGILSLLHFIGRYFVVYPSTGRACPPPLIHTHTRSPFPPPRRGRLPSPPLFSTAAYYLCRTHMIAVVPNRAVRPGLQ